MNICILHIANSLRKKNLAVVEMNCNSLESIYGCMVGLFDPQGHYYYFSFTATDQFTNFSTSNNLQYTVVIV